MDEEKKTTTWEVYWKLEELTDAAKKALIPIIDALPKKKS